MAIAKHSLLILTIVIALAASARAVVVTDSDPNNPIYLSSWTGIGKLTTGAGLCTGSLLSTGMHVLTAAHCVVDANGNLLPGVASLTFFNLLNDSFTYNSVSIVSHPDFVPLIFTNGNDLAIITLNSIVDASIGRFDLYTGGGELNSNAVVAGYGRAGTGATGNIPGSYGTRRQGLNEVDDILSNVMYYDFDNGLVQQNTLGGLGLGINEVMVSSGDSGGPSLISGQIAGIHSFITCVNDQQSPGTCLVPPDVDTNLNSSFGERFGDTRVSAYTDWIQGAVDGTEVPEPSTVVAGLLSAAICLARFRKTRSGSTN